MLVLGGSCRDPQAGSDASSQGGSLPQQGGTTARAEGGAAGTHGEGGSSAEPMSGGEAGARANGGNASEAGTHEAGGPTSSAGLGGAAGETARDPAGGSAGFPDIDFNVGGSTEPPLTPDDACVQARAHTEPIPLDAYIMLDRSGSMNLPQAMPIGNTTPGGGDCNVGETKESRWCNAINALNAFFVSQEAATSRVALQFFPAGTCQSSPNPLVYGCCSSGACCLGAAESTPEVGLGVLPAHVTPLRAALNAQMPWADRTPIEAALRGLLGYARAQTVSGRQLLAMLITDGGPEGCDANQSTLAALVRTYREKNRIPTYVIATQGAAYSWLEPIAAAGGAPLHDTHCAGGVKPCHFYDVGSAKSAVFVDVLQQIRRSAIACRFAVPESELGIIDPSRVRLSFTPAGSASSVRIERVSGAASCGTASGFFYDDAASPKNISLCPVSCDAVRAADGGDVELLVACLGS